MLLSDIYRSLHRSFICIVHDLPQYILVGLEAGGAIMTVSTGEQSGSKNKNIAGGNIAAGILRHSHFLVNINRLMHRVDVWWTHIFIKHNIKPWCYYDFSCALRHASAS
jgi:hypothetical protein